MKLMTHDLPHQKDNEASAQASCLEHDTLLRDEYNMRMALSFARRGTGTTSPNPMVGCVITDRAGCVLSYGWHERAGGPHAEAAALSRLPEDIRDFTAYVTLEPCSHTGRTPPCAEALINRGASRVVAAAVDPDPRVSGRGLARLRDAGIEVVSGVLEDECQWLNRGFIKRVTTGRPWVTMKCAVSADGAMALPNGVSKWITGEDARARGHMLRAENDVVLVGAGTVAADSPSLTVRDCDGRDPMRAVIDPRGIVPSEAAILSDGTCIVFAADERSISHIEPPNASVSIVFLRGMTKTECIYEILDHLGSIGVCRLLVEGGPSVASSFAKAGAIDEWSIFIAPMMLGRGMRAADTMEFQTIDEAIHFAPTAVTYLGQDVWLEGKKI